jgi:hypothetical protein
VNPNIFYRGEEMKKLSILVMLVIACLAMSTVVFAGSDSTGAATSVSTQDGIADQAIGTAIAEAGNVTKVTLSTTEPTLKWAAFYGDVSTTLQIGDVANNGMYQWSGNATDVATVYATQRSTVFDVADLTAPEAGDIDTMWTYDTAAVDSETRTFTQAATYGINSNGLNNQLSSVKTANLTVDSNVQFQAGYAVESSHAAKTNFFFLSDVIDNSSVMYNTDKINWAVMVPVDDLGQEARETYSFYMFLK